MAGYSQGSFEIIEHTADVGIRVTAATVAGLFEVAALALTELITRVDSVAPRIERRFQLQEESLEILLVSWLQELIYLLDTEGLVFGRFRVNVAGTQLEASGWGEPFDPEVHVMKTEVKAVTYHLLQVVSRGDYWQAQVIFDI